MQVIHVNKVKELACTPVARNVNMKIKISKETHVTMQRVTIIQKFRKLIKEHHLRQLILGGGPGAVHTHEVQHLV
jgi:hypothetical protein